MYMGETDPFVCLQVAALPAPAALVHPGGMSLGNRVGVALSYLTPDAQWQTIWRTLANPGE
ncbi:hypothetical protein GCM10010317_064300 [Streptomyces mirabilis]|nr:hypothetical protein BX281_9522 [Streptomyces sp. Ag82_O1-15]GHD65053.1 hypothetical protein GCM10010317_064300 [Streptomyces mirabilis]SOE78320.1 hypothetical protein SAMN05446589_7926 [Streptomyces sp. OV198]